MSGHPLEVDPILCVCGREYHSANGYATHVRLCKRYLKKVAQSQGDAQARLARRPPSRSKGRTGWTARFGQGDELDFDARPANVTGAGLGAGIGALDVPVAPGDIIASSRDLLEQEPSSSVGAPPSAALPLVEATLPEAGRGRGFRVKKPVDRFQDFYPSQPLPLGLAALGLPAPAPTRCSPSPSPESPTGVTVAAPLVRLPVQTTLPNALGIYKRYETTENLPHDPDAYAVPSDLLEEPAAHFMQALDTSEAIPALDTPNFAPYPNFNSFQLGEYFWSDDNDKSQASFRKLVSIIGDENFHSKDVRHTNWTAIDKELGRSEFEAGADEDSAWKGDGTSWKSTPIVINVPFNTTSKQPGSQTYKAGNLRHRPLVPLIRERLEAGTSPESFHHVPFEMRWKPGEGKADVRVHSELYNSDAFLEAHREVQNAPRPSQEDSMPHCVVGLMFASDATQLAAFGNAKIWPLYLFFSNDSKYRRGKTSLKLGEQVAYFEKLPDEFKDFVRDQSGKGKVGKVLLTHCQREAVHEQWVIILDDEFLEAYVHGIEVVCFDGIRRRFFPQIFTYTADYPEKILIASIKNLGKCPCPRCLIPLDEVHRLGKPMDRRNRVRLARADNEDRKNRISKARFSIYQNHRSVNSKIVEAHLHEFSLVPSLNAFSERLSPLSFNFYDMLVPDIMHEIELGVWKSLFIQILRLLDAEGGVATHELDARFRLVPTFGKDTIRRFRNNVSEMKQLAARDYEDLLQCSIPVVEGLLGESRQGKRTLKLLFNLAHWHGLAKLRLHTDYTLQILDDLTTTLGEQFRKFVEKVCIPADTCELPREYAARKRREAGKLKKGAVKRGNKRQKVSHEAKGADDEADMSTSARKRKILNLHTYKFHSMGHLVPNIRRYGTADNYSSQGPESYHRCPKRQYRRTAKRRIPETLSRIQTRQARLRRLRRQLLPGAGEGKPDPERKESYFVGKSQNAPIYLDRFMIKHREDVGARKFIHKLKLHLLPRICEVLLTEAQNDPSRSHILPVLQNAIRRAAPHTDLAPDIDYDRTFIDSNRLYEHKLLHVNYTSYDQRREQDILNPNTNRRDFMTLAANDVVDRFCYGRLLGVYHVNAVFLGEGSLDRRPRRFDILLVRWYATSNQPPSWSSQSLDVLEFPSLELSESIQFLDPALVLRACHVIPRFATGRDTAPSAKSSLAQTVDDWKQYYVNRFVDRDMLMRFHWGLGVGHAYSHPDAPAESSDSPPDSGETMDDDNPPVEGEVEVDASYCTDDTDSDDSECGLEDRQGEDWETNSATTNEDSDDLPEPDSDVEGG